MYLIQKQLRTLSQPIMDNAYLSFIVFNEYCIVNAANSEVCANITQFKIRASRPRSRRNFWQVAAAGQISSVL